jgi:hypothetical protein
VSTIVKVSREQSRFVEDLDRFEVVKPKRSYHKKTNRMKPPQGPSSASPGYKIDFQKLSWSELRKYFLHHVPSAVPSRNGLLAVCPFHADNNPSLSICLKEGSGGVWHCFGCRKAGKLTCFEKNLAERRGQPIDNRTAWIRVCGILKMKTETNNE